MKTLMRFIVLGALFGFSRSAAAEEAKLDPRAGKFFPLASSLKFDMRDALPRELNRLDVGATFAMRPRTDLQISFSARGTLGYRMGGEQFGFPFIDPTSAAAKEYFSDKQQLFTSVSDGERMRYRWDGRGIKVLGIAARYYFHDRKWVEVGIAHEPHTENERVMWKYEFRCYTLELFLCL